MQIYEFQNFVPKADCQAISHWLKANKKVEKNKEDFFDGITIPYVKITDRWVKKRVNQFRFDATMQAIVSFNKKLYPNYTDLVHWPVGKSMDVHGDSHYLDGSEGLFPYRVVSGVLYLNDNYSGGETYFPSQNVHVKPETGKLVLFPSNLDYPHGVQTVREHERFTMPIWFTEDSQYLET
jgi:hypothetical protein